MFCASPPAALALATMTVAPSVTRAAATVVAGVAVVAVPATVVAVVGTVVAPSGVSIPPASLLSIERKMRKPTTTAINASTIVSGEPTGDPESPTRVERARSALALTPPGSVGSLIVSRGLRRRTPSPSGSLALAPPA